MSPSDRTLRGRRRLLFSTFTQWYRLPSAMVSADANNYGHDEIPIRQCVARRQSRNRDYDSGSASLRYMRDVWKVWHGEGHGAGRGGLLRKLQWPRRELGEQRDARARDHPPAASGSRVYGFFPEASVSVATAAALLVAAAAAAAMRVVSAYTVPVIPLPFGFSGTAAGAGGSRRWGRPLASSARSAPSRRP